MQPNLISAIIPAYNAEKYISQAIDSILAQTYRPIEIIIVDDGSTDGTAAIARSYSGVRYVHHCNQGPAAARNAGLAHSTGDLIAFLDADDFWPRHKLAEQFEYLTAHPEQGCVIGRWQNFLEKGIERPDWIPESKFQEDVVALGLQGTLIDRWVFDRVGGFNPRYWHSDDLDWLVRVRESGISIGFMYSIMVYRRIHGDNISQNQNAAAKERVQSLKEHMDRVRKRHSRPYAEPDFG